MGLRSLETECLDGELFNASISFPYEANHNEGVRIQANGVDYGLFDGFSQPIILSNLNATDFATWEFEISDSQNESCQAISNLILVSCTGNNILDCPILEIKVNDIECSGSEEYGMTLNFDFNSEEDFEFKCMVNGEFILNANTTSLPLKMSGMTSTGNNVMETITICTNINGEECCEDFLYAKPNCLSNSAIDNSLLDGVIISPNPARDMVFISGIPQDIIGLTIVDNLGRTIKQIENYEDVRLDISNYQQGMYTIQFFTTDNRVMNKRFVKL